MYDASSQKDFNVPNPNFLRVFQFAKNSIILFLNEEITTKNRELTNRKMNKTLKPVICHFTFVDPFLELGRGELKNS